MPGGPNPHASRVARGGSVGAGPLRLRRGAARQSSTRRGTSTPRCGPSTTPLFSNPCLSLRFTIRCTGYDSKCTPSLPTLALLFNKVSSNLTLTSNFVSPTKGRAGREPAAQPGVEQHPEVDGRLHRLRRGQSEKDAKLAQKLGQLPPFLAVFPQECTGPRASSEPTQHLSRRRRASDRYSIPSVPVQFSMQ